MKLCRCTIGGYRTIKELDEFELRPTTVLIGPNGAGKSNFISFFRLLSWMVASPSKLQKHVGIQGGASKILHDGPGATRELRGGFVVKTETGENEYAFELSYAAGDILVFSDERYRYSGKEFPTKAPWQEIEPGGRETGMNASAERGDKTAAVILGLLRKLAVYQFHNTSFTSRMRTRWSLEDNRYLKEDGANLAPVLLELQQTAKPTYSRIVETLRVILPFFEDFTLDPEHDSVLLRWTESGSDIHFDASQASDGMLRTMALVTLLSLPPERLPGVLLLDEPELGLHPAAISVIAGMVKSVSFTNQVILATQSTTMVDEFDPADIVVVERDDRESSFEHLDQENLAQWLDDYSLADLWEKNLLGGRP